MKRNNISKLVVSSCIVMFSQYAHAAFVGGIPAGYVCTGTCGTAGANGDVALSPLGNSEYGYVVTNKGVTGVSPFSTGGERQGSKLVSNAFTAAAGDKLNFYFNYITSDGSGFADYSFARLLNASDNSQAALLFTAQTKPTGNIIPAQGLPPPNAAIPTAVINPNASNWSPLGGDSGKCYGAGCGSTGWVLSSFDIAMAGNYLLEFGVINYTDNNYQSGLAFDGITIDGKPIDPPSGGRYPAQLGYLALQLLHLQVLVVENQFKKFNLKHAWFF